MQATTIVPDSTHTGVQIVYGFSIEEDSGSTAAVELRAGGASGKIIVFLNLAANETATIVLPKAVYWEFVGDVHVKEVSGSIKGVLYH